MQQANDLNASYGLREPANDTIPGAPRGRAKLGSYKARLIADDARLSNVAARPFGSDTLACALTLAGTDTPTPSELAAALAKLYPDGTSPTVPDLLAAGWLVPAVSDRTRLRQPPFPLAEVEARLTKSPYPNKTRYFSPHAPNKIEQTHAPALAESRNETRAKSKSSKPLEKTDNGREAGKQVSLFSYYRGGIAATVPYAAITPAQLFAVLTSDRHRAATEALRAAPVGSPARAELKKRLDYVTPAGTFTRRANDSLSAPSGLLVLDFDHLPDISIARAVLLADELLAPDLVLLFTSPSGDGLKVFVRTDPTAAHLDNFRAYADYLAAHYAPLGLCPDEAGKDLARACFVPDAPDAWLAPAYAT